MSRLEKTGKQLEELQQRIYSKQQLKGQEKHEGNLRGGDFLYSYFCMMWS